MCGGSCCPTHNTKTDHTTETCVCFCVPSQTSFVTLQNRHADLDMYLSRAFWEDSNRPSMCAVRRSPRYTIKIRSLPGAWFRLCNSPLISCHFSKLCHRKFHVSGLGISKLQRSHVMSAVSHSPNFTINLAGYPNCTCDSPQTFDYLREVVCWRGHVSLMSISNQSGRSHVCCELSYELRSWESKTEYSMLLSAVVFRVHFVSWKMEQTLQYRLNSCRWLGRSE
jgi:hypothetical protein